MSDFSQNIYTVSLVLSLIVGSVMGMMLRGSEQQTWLLPFCVIATLVHLLWLAWPVVPASSIALTRGVFALWVGAMLVAAALLPLFAASYLISPVRRLAASQHLPALYVGICVTCALALCLGGASLRIREETVLIGNLDPRLDGLRAANFGDVDVDRFIGPTGLAEAVQAVASRDVGVLAVTGDLIDDHRQIEPTLDALDDGRFRSIVAVIGIDGWNVSSGGELQTILPRRIAASLARQL